MPPALCLFLLMQLGMSSQTASAIEASTPRVAGAVNFRDIGGLRTTDGRVVRSGRIFRSGELSHLTPQDFEQLAPIHIAFIFDLRTDAERGAAPTVWIGEQPKTVRIPVGFVATASSADMTRQMFTNGTDPVHVGQAMQAITVKIAIDGAPQIGQLLRDLAHGDEPAIIHCTAGKDRTGVVTAVLLRVLGVPLETVYDDYLRSNASVPDQLARLRTAASGSSVPPALAQLPAGTLNVLMGVDRSYLESAFNSINSKYGTFDAYVRDGLGLSTLDVQKLQDRLLKQPVATQPGAAR